MLPLPPAFEPVPLSDVADVLAEAARRCSAAPSLILREQGRDLAASLELAGFVVVRRPQLRPQLTP